MINRVIYSGNVYYKVADLAFLFDVTKYKMRKFIKDNNLGEILKGFGRTTYVLEENVAKIDVNGKGVIIKTKITESVDKFKTVVEEVTEKMKISADGKLEKVEETPVEKLSEQDEKAEKKNAETVENVAPIETKVENEPNLDEIEAIQEELAQLIKKAKYYVVKFFHAKKMNIVHDICDKHLGKGNKLEDSIPSDIVAVRLVVEEIKIAYANLDESSNKDGEVKISELSDKYKDVDLVAMSDETEITEVQV